MNDFDPIIALNVRIALLAVLDSTEEFVTENKGITCSRTVATAEASRSNGHTDLGTQAGAMPFTVSPAASVGALSLNVSIEAMRREGHRLPARRTGHHSRSQRDTQPSHSMPVLFLHWLLGSFRLFLLSLPSHSC